MRRGPFMRVFRVRVDCCKMMLGVLIERACGMIRVLVFADSGENS